MASSTVASCASRPLGKKEYFPYPLPDTRASQMIVSQSTEYVVGFSPKLHSDMCITKYVVKYFDFAQNPATGVVMLSFSLSSYTSPAPYHNSRLDLIVFLFLILFHAGLNGLKK